MRKVTRDELDQVADRMLEIFFDEIDVSMVIRGIGTDTAKAIIRENLYRDMEYFLKYGDVFISDDDMSGIVALIDGKRFSIFKKTMMSLKSNKVISQAATKEELRLLNINAKKVQEVHSFNWYKKRDIIVPYYLAHIYKFMVKSFSTGHAGSEANSPTAVNMSIIIKQQNFANAAFSQHPI